MHYMHIFAVVVLLISGTLALDDIPTVAVQQLRNDNFDSLITDTEDVWVVEFFVPWCQHCLDFVPEYEKAAKALWGVANVGSVNCRDYKPLADKYEITSYPTIKIFVGSNHKPYVGAKTAEDIVEYVLREISKKVYKRLNIDKKTEKPSGKVGVVTLTEKNFRSEVMESEDLWLVEFYAPWCGHCKNLEPQWAKAAVELNGKVKLGALDATVHQNIASHYNIRGYPTIKLFPAGKKSDGEVEDYNGGRTSSDIVNWALSKLAEMQQPPKVLEIINDDIWMECNDKPLCVLSILPHILDCGANCRNDYITILKRLGNKYKNKMWGWVWAEAQKQANIEKAFEIGGFGYPAMAVVNAKKLKYSTLKGSFSESGINEFLRDLSFGRGQTSPVNSPEMPRAVKADPWDGQDGQLHFEEEMIDLSDVDLDREEL